MRTADTSPERYGCRAWVHCFFGVTVMISPTGLCWRATNGRVEHVTCEPFFCATEDAPQHPLLIRVLVNKVTVGLVEERDAVAAEVAREGGLVEEGEPRLPSRWSLELAAFPGEQQYLVWKLRQTQKGRIRVGPIERRATGEAADVKVLPLRKTAAEIETLDAGWRRLAFKSRTAMLKKAIADLLAAGCGA